MKPQDFWNADYREIVRYCNMNHLRVKEDFKERILLEEASTDKMLMADSIGQKHPKIISLVRDSFEKFFKNN